MISIGFLQNRLIKNSILSVIDQVLSVGMSFLLSVLMARYMGASSLGAYTIALSLAGVVIGITNFGILPIVKREVARNAELKLALYYGQAVLIRIFLSLPVSVLIIIPLSYALDFTGDTFYAIVLGCFYTNFTAFVLLSNGVLISLHRNDTVLLINVLLKLFSLVSVSVLLLSGGGLIGVMYTLVLVSLALAFYSFLHVNKHPGKMVYRPRLKFIRTLIIISLPLSLAGFAEFLSLKIDNLILGYLMDESAVGYYSAAFNILLGFVYIPLALSKVYFPNFISLLHDKGNKAAFQLFIKYLFLFSIYSAVIALFLVLFSEFLIGLVYGEAFAMSAGVVAVLALALPALALNRLVNYSLVAYKENGYVFRIVLAGLVINIAANLYLIPLYAMKGAAIATIATETTVLLLGLYKIFVIKATAKDTRTCAQ